MVRRNIRKHNESHRADMPVIQFRPIHERIREIVRIRRFAAPRQRSQLDKELRRLKFNLLLGHDVYVPETLLQTFAVA